MPPADSSPVRGTPEYYRLAQLAKLYGSVNRLLAAVEALLPEDRARLPAALSAELGMLQAAFRDYRLTL